MTYRLAAFLFLLVCGANCSANDAPDTGQEPDAGIVADANNSDASLLPDAEGGPTCDDGIRNQGELDTDCGGPCEPCSDCSLALRSEELACQRQRYEEFLSHPSCSHGFYSGNDENGTKYSFFSSQYDAPRVATIVERSGDCFRFEIETGGFLGRLNEDPHFARIGPLAADNFNNIRGNEAFSHNTTFLPAPGSPLSVEIHFGDKSETLEFPMPVRVQSMTADPFTPASEELRVHFTYPNNRPETPTTIAVTIGGSIACVVDSSYDSLSIPAEFLGEQTPGDRIFVRAQGYEFAARESEGCGFRALVSGRNPGAERETTLRVDVQ